MLAIYNFWIMDSHFCNLLIEEVTLTSIFILKLVRDILKMKIIFVFGLKHDIESFGL